MCYKKSASGKFKGYVTILIRYIQFTYDQWVVVHTTFSDLSGTNRAHNIIPRTEKRLLNIVPSSEAVTKIRFVKIMIRKI